MDLKSTLKNSSAHKIANIETISIPQTQSEYYKELTTRNHHFIKKETQERLSKIRVLVAGCGATGGACIEPLARVGVQNFILADQGFYELNNLNRQHALIRDLGKNKAEFHKEQVLEINPFAQVKTFSKGIDFSNVVEVVRSVDFIIDAVDITNSNSMSKKFEMHRIAKDEKKPIITGMDLGFCQWGVSFDYRVASTPILGGYYEKAIKCKHPVKAWLSYVPLSAMPDHCLELVYDMATRSDLPASQLGCASDLLSSIVVATVVRYVETGELVSGWNVNLEYIALSWKERLRLKMKAPLLRRKIKKILDQLE